MKIVLATGNPGKVAELARLLEGIRIELIPLSEVQNPPAVVEDQSTFRGNARKKAHELYLHTGLPALADDSGLEVQALGGEPGVHSARFAGPDADDAANRRRLLERMAEISDRSARFRTVIALASDDEVVYFEGTCNGQILEKERGSGGFGYDSLFLPEGLELSFAEMDADAKNATSHRGRAVRTLSAYLRRITTR